MKRAEALSLEKKGTEVPHRAAVPAFFLLPLDYECILELFVRLIQLY